MGVGDGKPSGVLVVARHIALVEPQQELLCVIGAGKDGGIAVPLVQLQLGEAVYLVGQHYLVFPVAVEVPTENIAELLRRNRAV